jgi:hypothetical protein
MFQYCKFTSSFGSLHKWKSAYKDIGIAMYEAGGSKHDTFQKDLELARMMFGLSWRWSVSSADLGEAFPGS